MIIARFHVLSATPWQGCAIWAALCLLVPTAADGQLLQPGVMLARSRSGQFVIESLPAGPNAREAAELETRTNFVRLDPTLLAVSSERIKQLLWHELGAQDAWSAKIFLKIYPAASSEDPVTIASEQFRDGWHYGLALPNVVERSRYVRSLVGVLLLEFANRGARGHSAELPTWLVEGLAGQLLASSQLEIILPPPNDMRAGIKMTSILVSNRREHPLARAHQDLTNSQPMSFEQLSWPSAGNLAALDGKLYRSSAQFFVSELLGLPQGQSCLRQMLVELPRYYNWQFAFLHAFHAYFQRPLDIEKWWSLHLAHFTGRQLAQTWSLEQSWYELDQILHSAVEVRLATNDLPLQVQVPLQTILREWDFARQTQALQGKLHDLQAARLRLSPQLVPLLDEYSAILQACLQTGEPADSGLVRRKRAARYRLPEGTLRRLDDLEAHRALLKPSASAVVKAQTP